METESDAMERYKGVGWKGFRGEAPKGFKRSVVQKHSVSTLHCVLTNRTKEEKLHPTFVLLFFTS